MQWRCFGTVRFRSSKELSSRYKQVNLEEKHWSIPALWMSSSFQEWGWSKSKLGANAILAVAWHQHGTMRPLWRTKAENPKLIGDHSRFYQDLVHFAFLRNITLTSVAKHAMIMPVFSLQTKQCQFVKRGVHGNLPCWRSSAGSATLPATRPQLLIIQVRVFRYPRNLTGLIWFLC